MRNLTQEELIQLQAYKGTCERLNTLHSMRNDINLEAWQRSMADQAYYQAMTYCDDLLWWFGLRNLDAETLLENYKRL